MIGTLEIWLERCLVEVGKQKAKPLEVETRFKLGGYEAALRDTLARISRERGAEKDSVWPPPAGFEDELRSWVDDVLRTRQPASSPPGGGERESDSTLGRA